MINVHKRIILHSHKRVVSLTLIKIIFEIIVIYNNNKYNSNKLNKRESFRKVIYFDT